VPGGLVDGWVDGWIDGWLDGWPASLIGSAMPGQHRRAPAAAALALAAVLAAPASLAQSVTLSGSMGADKALLMIDGQPQMLVVGGSARGVTLRRLGDGEAEVEVAGRILPLRLGAAPSRVGGAVPTGDTTIVLPMGPGGHFSAAGAINGKPVDFMVDTGATTIALSQGEANRIGLDWKRGRPGLSNTANGTVPVYQVNLTSVRVGSVEIANVAAIVVPSDMPQVLLGNSFLNRFSMRRDSDVMRLERKP
jgi:aspartyl protease family protein